MDIPGLVVRPQLRAAAELPSDPDVAGILVEARMPRGMKIKTSGLERQRQRNKPVRESHEKLFRQCADEVGRLQDKGDYAVILNGNADPSIETLLLQNVVDEPMKSPAIA